MATLEEKLCSQKPRRSLVQALSATSGMPSQTTRIIAEIKQASPSKGILRANLEPIPLAQAYQRGGAAAISVLTEQHFFLGKLNHLEQIREVSSLPILRKDFLFDPYQLYEARAYGADAVLLIADILEGNQLGELVDVCREVELEALIEVHTREELEKVLESKTRLIGINNRNLHTFQTDLRTTLELIREIPEGKIAVSESGIRNREDIVLLENAGVAAFLIGESLVRADDPAARLRALLGKRV